MGNGFPERFNAYAGSVFKSREGRQFLGELVELSRRVDAMELNRDRTSGVVDRTSVGSGGGGGGMVEAPGEWRSDVEPVRVPNSVGLGAGQLVVYRGRMVGAADCRSERAIYACVGVQGGFALLVPRFSEGFLRVRGSRGGNAEGRLWLSENGTVTDELGDLVDTTTGRPNHGIVVRQLVGYRQGLSGRADPAGYVRCSFDAQLPSG